MSEAKTEVPRNILGSKEAFAAVSVLKERTLYVDALDATVRIRALSYEARSAIEASNVGDDGKILPAKLMTAGARYVAAAVVDDNGALIFDDDIEAVGRMPTDAVEQIYAAVQDLSGMTRKALEDIEGN